jgi:hypothetical protein
MSTGVVHGASIAASEGAVRIEAHSKVVVLKSVLCGKFGAKTARLAGWAADRPRRLEGARAVIPLVTNGRASVITASVGGVMESPGTAAALDRGVDADTVGSGC